MKRSSWYGTSLAALFGAGIAAHSPEGQAAAPARGAGVKEVEPTRIAVPGGAVAYLVESHELPLVDISLSFRSGSALDRADQIGRTRLLARMMRRGAQGWTSEQIEERIDRLGGELSFDVGPSSITMHAQVIKRNLQPFVALITELLARPTFPADELARLQRETVAEIIEARDQDKALVSRFFRRALFGKHPYGRGSSGTTKTIPGITREDVVAAHQTHIRQGNVVLGVSGDLTEAELRAILLPLLTALPPGAGHPDEVTDPPRITGRRLVFVDKPARTQTQILIGGSGTRPDDDDHTALHVANTVFGGTFTARLMKEVRSVRGWSYGAYSRLPIDRRREAFSMWTFPAATDAPACLALELELLETLLRDGISEAELTFARSYLVESHAFDIDTAFKRVRQAVDEDVYGLPTGYHRDYIQHVSAVTLAQANHALRHRLSSDDLLIVVVGTAAELKDKLVAAIPRLSSVEVLAFDSE